MGDIEKHRQGGPASGLRAVDYSNQSHCPVSAPRKGPASPVPVWHAGLARRGLCSRSLYLSRRKTNAKRILFVDPATHLNIGDNLIVEGTLRLLRALGWRDEFIVPCFLYQGMVAPPLLDHCGDFAQYYDDGQDALALWQGGGNWGDLYVDTHAARMASLERLLHLNFTVVGMPQSMHYTQDAAAKRDAAHLDKLFNEAPGRLILCWRQIDSWHEAKRLFSGGHPSSCP